MCPSSLNTKDIWINFETIDPEIILWFNTASTDHTVLLLDNVDCSSNSATEQFCYNKDVSGTQYFVKCTPLTVGQTYYMVILIPESAPESNIQVCYNGNSSIAPNETCDLAVPLSGTLFETCTTIELEGINYYSCPSDHDYGNCGTFNTKYTVWHKFTTDNSAEFVEIEVNAIVNGPQPFIIIDAALGCASTSEVSGCITSGSLINQPILPNHDYFIIVAPDIGNVGGPFELSINVYGPDPPLNDEACDAIELIPDVPILASTDCADQDIF